MIARGPVAAFGDAEIAAMLAAVGRSRDDRPDDVLASGAWSCLVEPGDATGGVLRTVFGPAAALAALDLPDAEIERQLERRGVAEASRIDLAAARRRWEPRSTPTTIRSAFRAAGVLGIRLLVPGDREWPTGLDDLGVHGPAALWVRGRPGALVDRPSIALVGSRAATGYGEQVAAELADGVVGRGFSVFSGGAYGIDGMAHRAALASGGTTVAIMAGGVDRFYPSGHHDLLRRISETGAVVAEVACGVSPSRWRFLQRNRLLAAASAATVVVEAGHRSGALNTATHARSLDRPLGAVPGPITSPSSAGCHRLLGEPEVACITGPDDAVRLAAPGLVGDTTRFGPGRDAPGEMRVLDALSTRAPRTESDLARRAGMGERDVRGILAVLELVGRAAERDAGWVRCG